MNMWFSTPESDVVIVIEVMFLVTDIIMLLWRYTPITDISLRKRIPSHFIPRPWYIHSPHPYANISRQFFRTDGTKRIILTL